MKIAIEAARALTYETSRICDLENNNARVLETGLCTDKDDEKRRKLLARSFKRLNGMLTPMSKYYCSEMCVKTANDAIQVLGGSGYIKDYATERYLRDARITTIYEGTSQLQVVAAVRGVASGALETWVEPHEKKQYDDPMLAELKEQLIKARERLMETLKFVKTRGTAYLDLSGRRLVDSAVAIVAGHLLLGQGAANDRKKRVARRFLHRELAVLQMNCGQILTGDAAPLEEYALLAGPVPAND
jgi:3-(methylthio)propanoyl-CoA dehydrogenase